MGSKWEEWKNPRTSKEGDPGSETQLLVVSTSN
jgi:hypothetical protein